MILNDIIEYRGIKKTIDQHSNPCNLKQSAEINISLIKLLTRDHKNKFSQHFVNKVKDIESLEVNKAVEVCELQIL